jgi:hypothetical protein
MVSRTARLRPDKLFRWAGCKHGTPDRARTTMLVGCDHQAPNQHPSPSTRGIEHRERVFFGCPLSRWSCRFACFVDLLMPPAGIHTPGRQTKVDAPGRRQKRPSTPCSAKRCCQRQTIGRLTPTFMAICCTRTAAGRGENDLRTLNLFALAVAIRRDRLQPLSVQRAHKHAYCLGHPTRFARRHQFVNRQNASEH